MLRRQKNQTLNGKPLLNLPKRTVSIVSCPFDASELAFYNALENKMEHVIEKLMSQTKGNSAYMSVLLLLLRLRQGLLLPTPIFTAD
jgi:SNF2 family DNA or RNA helicase